MNQSAKNPSGKNYSSQLCPFCGANEGEEHASDPECYLKIHSKMVSGSSCFDVGIAKRAVDAWRRRTVPTGLALVLPELNEIQMRAVETAIERWVRPNMGMPRDEIQSLWKRLLEVSEDALKNSC